MFNGGNIRLTRLTTFLRLHNTLQPLLFRGALRP